MRFLKRYIKAPGDELDYDVDIAAWLAGRVDTVSTFVIDADDGIEILSQQLLGTKIRGFVGGGLPGRAYTVQITVVTNGGRKKTFAFQVRVRGVALVETVAEDGGTGDEAAYNQPPFDAGTT